MAVGPGGYARRDAQNPAYRPSPVAFILASDLGGGNNLRGEGKEAARARPACGQFTARPPAPCKTG